MEVTLISGKRYNWKIYETKIFISHKTKYELIKINNSEMIRLRTKKYEDGKFYE